MKILYIIIGIMISWFIYLKIENQLNFNSCLEEAHNRYARKWEYYCQILDMGNNCNLPNPIAAEILDKMFEDQQVCAVIYK